MQPVKILADGPVLRSWQPADATSVQHACHHLSRRASAEGSAGRTMQGLLRQARTSGGRRSDRRSGSLESTERVAE